MTLLLPPTNKPPAAPANWQAVTRAGFIFVVGVLGVAFVWALVARLDGAAVAQGVVSVETNRKTIQHLEGGIVSDILVRDGDVVREGQVLLRLDPTRTDSASNLYRTQLAIAQAQEARLLAERDLQESFVFPQEVLDQADTPAVARAIKDQKSQFTVRHEALVQAVEVANAQLAQAKKESEQNDSDQQTARSTVANVKRELEAVRSLYERNLVALPRLTTLEREQLRLEGVVANTEAGRAKLQEKIQEFTVRRDKATQDYRTDAASQLTDVQNSINELRQQLIVASDSQRRIDLRAPIMGVVQQLRIFTVGGVVRPGDPVLDIVPISDTLIIKAKVSPLDADRVMVDMDAEVRFPSFRSFRLQLIHGKLSALSRDRLIDDVTKEPYFDAQVKVAREDLPAQILEKLVAGMPAEVIIPTEERTVFNYLVTPIAERFQTSMRER